ncbi:MAG: DsbA family protein [Paracoccaceae bacterium]|nr:DsbA family protein [Paracoccaceae bacterium]
MIRILALLLTLAATQAAAFDIDAMTPAEREAFRSEIRAYLLENPEILVEAIAVLDAREAEGQAANDAAMIAANAAALFDDGHSWVGGNPDGDVTIVEFLDYRCGFCRRAHPVIGELLETDGNIRLVVKEFPILGEQSVLASRFALAVKAAHGDGAYKRVHDALMELRANVSEEALAGVAEAEGLEPAPLLAAMNAPEITAIIEENRALARAMEINGTPSFVVGEQLLRGFLPLEGMQSVVAEAREG